MKTVSVGIISSIVLFLSVQPGIEGMEVETIAVSIDQEKALAHKCCSKPAVVDTYQADKQDQHQDKGCCGSNCNPFKVCGSCFWVNFSLQFDYSDVAFVTVNKGFSNESFYSNLFTNDFWQPPRLAC